LHAGSLTAADVGGAQRAFSVDLVRAVCGTSAKGNVVVSGTSAAEALGLLYAGARGTTADAVGKVLHLPAWDAALVAAVAGHTQALGSIRGPKKDEGLFLSNRVWSAKSNPPTQQYLDDVATAYASDARTVDFAGDPGGATNAINATVDKDTSGLIKKLFDGPLPRDTVTVLTNAMYLKATWLTPFEMSAPTDFHAVGGVESVPMMSGASGAGRSSSGWRSVELPYVGGKLSAVAILPPAGTSPCAVKKSLYDALTLGTGAVTDVQMPKLHFEQSHDLLGVLKDMGLPLTGDYSGLGGATSISQVVQKTYLDVDEQGTTAAAATGVAMLESRLMTVEPPLVLDRPFLFVLTDAATHSPLFTAVVNDPTQKG
jgi:serpin B